MKKIAVFLFLLIYGAIAFASKKTIFVNKTRYEAEIIASTSKKQVGFCQTHGINTTDCHKVKIRILSGEGYIITDDIYVDAVLFKDDKSRFYFNVQKQFFPHKKIEKRQHESHFSNIKVSEEENEHIVIINIQLSQVAPSGFHTLHFEEPRLLQDSENKSNTEAPMIFTSQNQYIWPRSPYINGYGSNCYVNQCDGKRYA